MNFAPLIWIQGKNFSRWNCQFVYGLYPFVRFWLNGCRGFYVINITQCSWKYWFHAWLWYFICHPRCWNNCKPYNKCNTSYSILHIHIFVSMYICTLFTETPCGVFLQVSASLTDVEKHRLPENLTELALKFECTKSLECLKATKQMCFRLEVANQWFEDHWWSVKKCLMVRRKCDISANFYRSQLRT